MHFPLSPPFPSLLWAASSYFLFWNSSGFIFGSLDYWQTDSSCCSRFKFSFSFFCSYFFLSLSLCLSLYGIYLFPSFTLSSAELVLRHAETAAANADHFQVFFFLGVVTLFLQNNLDPARICNLTFYIFWSLVFSFLCLFSFSSHFVPI